MHTRVLSQGHQHFDADYEYFIIELQIYQAPIWQPLDIDGHRYGKIPITTMPHNEAQEDDKTDKKP